jgi:GntR family transcriptional regulator, carbon starvation induced regulator
MDSSIQTPSTASEMVVAQLKQDIFTGALPPSAKLKVKELADRYGVGPTSIREAMSHLAATGVINHHAQRGFRVPPMTLKRYIDLMETRRIVECEAFKLAVQNGNSAWEDGIVSSYSLLMREIERIYNREVPTIDSYWERHAQFHRALWSACPLESLKGFVDDVHLRLRMFRRLTYTDGIQKEFVVEEHRKLMEVALSRDIDSAIVAMRQHIGKNTEVMKGILV